MHKTLTTLTIAVVVAASVPTLAMVALQRPSSSSSSSSSSLPPAAGAINVDGTATIAVVPDIATMTFEITRSAPTREAAEQAADEGVTAVLEALTTAGAAPDELRTLTRQATPTYAHDRHGQPLYLQVTRWTVSRRVRACAHAAAVVPSWQQAARRAGAVEVGQVAWETSQLQALKSQARLQAAAIAREKALALVDTLGGQLGAPTSINESAASTDDAAAYKQANAASRAEGDEGAVVVADSASGKIAVVATVQVTFEVLRR